MQAPNVERSRRRRELGLAFGCGFVAGVGFLVVAFFVTWWLVQPGGLLHPGR
jgi:hypothetical protein